MTQDELKELYTSAYKIIQRERRMRLWVFRNQPDKLTAKIGEMDRLLKIVTDFKDELKKHVGVKYEQPALIDVPRRQQYR